MTLRIGTVLFALQTLPAQATPAQALAVKPQLADGYRGIWYANQKSGDEYVYKYSGGLATYCAKHRPFAVYAKAADKTFFCYGATAKGSFRKLHHAVSFFDHATGKVPRPRILLDKRTSDAHDNPVLTLDGAGHLWIFSTSHGRARPSFIHRSKKPYDIDAFERVPATYLDDEGKRRPLDNFSYLQVWHVGDRFVCFFTRYRDPVARTSMFMTSRDGVAWSRWQRLAAIEKGHYQISFATRNKAATACNYHPRDRGLNWRTNLYYIETRDGGESWVAADGTRLSVPLTKAENRALVKDYEKLGLKVYLKDIRFNAAGEPAILFLTSRGYESGPENAPRTWRLARWRKNAWAIHDITTSDNNYDMGSLFGAGPEWQVIAPTRPGPQRFNPGGEVDVWSSRDDGRTWKRERQLTTGSERNHTYVRRPVNGHDDFYALWADGHGRQPSPSHLYFTTRRGATYRLPDHMPEATALPTEVTPGKRATPRR